MPRYAGLIYKLASVRTAFLERLEAASPEARSHRPSSEKWSPLEVAEHVYRVERGTLTVLERQVEKGESYSPIGAPSQTKLLGLLSALRSPLKFQAPTVKGLALEGLSWDMIRDGWIATGDRWSALDEALPDHLTKRALFKHPRGGPLTMEGSLRFLIVHGQRHQRQLERRLPTRTE